MHFSCSQVKNCFMSKFIESLFAIAQLNHTKAINVLSERKRDDDKTIKIHIILISDIRIFLN